jgi:hypothetical protein
MLKATARREWESLRTAVLANTLSTMLRASTHVIDRHASASGRGLSDDGYRFGFNAIAPGGMAKKGPHSGTVFFANPRVARRGYTPQYPAHVDRTVSPRVLAELYAASMAGISSQIEGLDREKDKQEFVKRIGSRARNSDL